MSLGTEEKVSYLRDTRSKCLRKTGLLFVDEVDDEARPKGVQKRRKKKLEV